MDSLRARVFDDSLRDLANEIRVAAGKSVWATSLDAAKAASEPLEGLNDRFNRRIGTRLPNLY
ncbi:hypothetical protein [Nocardia crassostreae]|uniref:hypothetical protein n=1 Tax=Nocardia crassostreae TaxID=53428 RepID=UPI0012F9847A|nr:hypothetical protein [Nocardia crassostreae]